MYNYYTLWTRNSKQESNKILCTEDQVTAFSHFHMEVFLVLDFNGYMNIMFFRGMYVYMLYKHHKGHITLYHRVRVNYKCWLLRFLMDPQSQRITISSSQIWRILIFRLINWTSAMYIHVFCHVYQKIINNHYKIKLIQFDNLLIQIIAPHKK